MASEVLYLTCEDLKIFIFFLLFFFCLNYETFIFS